MKTIVITGPSGSGKSFLSNKLSKLFYNTILIKTDSYYRDNILIRLLSLFIQDIYDRTFTIKINEIKNTIRYIYNKEKLISFYKYDFKRKKSSKEKLNINYNGNNQLLIIEGIFAHRLNLNYQNIINIICVEGKEICLKRRLNRDQLERGRDKHEVYKKFNKSWYLFYENVKSFLNENKVLTINTLDNKSFNNLVLKIKAKN